MSNTAEQFVNIFLNGEKYSTRANQTILQVAEEAGLKIPTLCHDPRIEPYGSCWVCIVKVEGARGFVPACATKIREGLKIVTEDEEIRTSRKIALELLLSNHFGDCKPPCTLTCPSNIDVQGYVGLIANEKYSEALKLIKKDNPFPSVCGRVCPRPCEDACRRNLVDTPVAIDWLKRYVADLDLFSDESFDPSCAVPVGKRVAIVGGGPAGLSAAYYLVQEGIKVTVFEGEEKAGGMLRYGIPDYRLPQDLLDAEIATISRLGVEIRPGMRLGRDISLDQLQKDYDAVILALGAWKSRPMQISGEDLPCVISGIEFLRKSAKGTPPSLGKRIAVIGGGNTAIDAARTSLRLGSQEVSIFYRRSRAEMPATDMEIEEALEEGVNINYLAAPVAIEKGPEGYLLTLIKMELGEPDASGRQRPVPVAGSEYKVQVDTVIAAIGQFTDVSSLIEKDSLLDKRGNFLSDPQTGGTKIPGVFGAGDLVTGTDIAIRAIAGGKFAARSVMQYLEGKEVTAPFEFLVKKEEFKPVTSEDLADKPKIPRNTMPIIPLEKRVNSFQEIELGFTEEQAKAEAARCLECGCKDVKECKLKEYSQEYGAVVRRYKGEFQTHPIDESHPFIERDPSKCILCGRCIRICSEVQGIGVFGYIKRGFASLVAPSFDKPFGEEESCISCGQCVSACPVGALTEKFDPKKTVPLPENIVEGYCTLCSVSCPVEYRYHGSFFTRVTDRYEGTVGGKLCEKGRFRNLFVREENYETRNLLAGEEIPEETATRRLRKNLASAKKVLIRISPYLAGEGMDLLIEKAVKKGYHLAPLDLVEIEESWLDLPGREGNRFFEEPFAGSRQENQKGIALVIGALEDSNNVAFTELYRLKKAGSLELWIVGRDTPLSRRVADRVFPDFSQFPQAFRYALLEKKPLEIFTNPEELHETCERETEERIIETLAGEKASFGLNLFWNSRNGGYLLDKLKKTGLRPEKFSLGLEDFDIVLDIGEGKADYTPESLVRLGKDPKGSTLFLPLHRDLWLGGTSYPTGKKPLVSGRLESSLLKREFSAILD